MIDADLVFDAATEAAAKRGMRGATLFSGVGAPEIAAPWIDWRWCAEIDPFASAVLAHRHPQIPNLGDVSHADFIDRARAFGAIDVLVFGSPCQSFSVAGKRAGLDDARGNLALVALGIVRALRPTWFLFENVPGLLSSWSSDESRAVEGSDFATFLCGVEECGYSGGWASPDAQWFGVPQRRERIFFVGHSGNWTGPAAVLSEFHCLQGNPPARGEAREDVAGTLGGGTGDRGWCPDTDRMTFIPDVSFALNAKGGSGRTDGESETFITHALRADGFDASEDGTGRGTPLTVVSTLTGNGDAHSGFRDEHGLVIFDTTQVTSKANRSNPKRGDPCHPLAAGAHPPAVAFRASGQDGFTPSGVTPPVSATDGGGAGVPTIQTRMAVRRLTPRECERLQGMPTDFTLVPYRGKFAADGPRYKAIGNSMAVPVVAYLLDRMRQVSELQEATC